MAPDESTKPVDPKPEDHKAEAPNAAEAPAAPEAPAAAAATSDPMKQVGAAAHDVGASVDKALGGMDAQNRFILVLVLSIVVGGWLGAILNGQVMKGVAILIAAFVLFMLGIFTLGLGFLLLSAVHVVAVVDACLIASRINKGEKFGDWDFFWTKPAPPSA